MKAKFIRQYRSKNPATLGKKMWGYKLILTPEERVAFAKQQGKYFLEDKVTKEVIWNKDEDHGQAPEIVTTQEGKFTMVLDEEQVAYEKATKRPLFADMYFKQAEQRANETLEQRIARKKGTAVAPVIAPVVNVEDADFGG